MLNGLKRYGQTCYFISCMQLLFHIEEIQFYFKSYLKYDNYDNITDTNNKKLVIILDKLKDIYNVIIGNNIENNLKDIVEILLTNAFTEFKSLHNQGDAAKLLNDIISLYDINNKLINYVYSDKITEFSEVLLNFNNNMIIYDKIKDEDKNKCKNKDAIRINNESSIIIHSSNFSNGNLIDYIFNIYNMEEIEYYCNNVTLERTYFYNIKSKYFIINFIPYNILFMLQFTIDIYKTFSINNKIYQIKGIVRHIGSTIKSGHYNYLSFENDKWYLYDDNNIYNINDMNGEIYTFTNEQNIQPYLFIYEEKSNITTTNNIVSNIPKNIQEIINEHNKQYPIQTKTDGTNITNNIDKLEGLINDHFKKLNLLHDIIKQNNI